MTQSNERDFVIPLRKEWMKVPYYKRARKAVMAIKKFIAKHMKVAERDLNKVKIDKYLNNEIWFRGKSNPPAKLKVKAVKEGDIVRVDFVEMPDFVKFLKAKHSKFHKKTEKPKEKPAEAKPEEQKTEEEKKEKIEEKKEEIEKEKSVEQQHIKQAKDSMKVQKHVTKAEKSMRPTRQALKK